MASQSPNSGSQENEDEGNRGEEQPLSSGRGPYSRMDDTLEAYYQRKEAKRSKQPSTGLGRRTGLNRGSVLKKTPLNPISKKQQKKLREYKKAREEHYSDEENQKCFLCGSTKNLSIHHIAKRGNLISDQSRFITLCLTGNYLNALYPDHNQSGAGCHGHVEANKDWARQYGYIE